MEGIRSLLSANLGYSFPFETKYISFLMKNSTTGRSLQRVHFNKFSLSHSAFSAILAALWLIANAVAEIAKIQRR
jgi:hypothetical protein